MTWYWPFPSLPRLDWVQVEISSICPARCIYCPQTLFRRQWLNALMDERLFNGLLPLFRRCGLVYLQGWGEPLTHPNFFDFLRLAKNTGSRVGTTSNGMLLNQHQCERLVGEQLDILGLSLAGTDADNDRVRRGTSLAKVLSLMDTLARIKRRAGTDWPAVHVAYLLVRSGLDGMHRLPTVLKDKGIAQVVITTIDPFDDPLLREEALTPASADEETHLTTRLAELVAAGKEAGLSIHLQLPFATDQYQSQFHPFDGSAPLTASRGQGCRENVELAAFVGVTGTVSPCVFANLPVAATPRHPLEMAAGRYHPPVFGDLRTSTFGAIWRSQGYAAFRHGHHVGTPPDWCRHCLQWSDRST